MPRQGIVPLREHRWGRYGPDAEIERELRRIDDDLRVYWSRLEDPRRTFFGKRGLKERWQVYRLGRRVPVLLHRDFGRETVWYVKRVLVPVMTVEDGKGGYLPLDRRVVLKLARMTDIHAFGGRTVQDAVRRANDDADEKLKAHRRKLDRDLGERCEDLVRENLPATLKAIDAAQREYSSGEKAPRWTRG